MAGPSNVGRCAFVVVCLFVLGGCAEDDVGLGRGYSHSWGGYHFPSHALSPSVEDRTSRAGWSVAARVAEWAAAGTPIQPVPTAAGGDVVVRERRSPFYLGLAQIRVDADGHILEGRVDLNPVLFDPPYTDEAVRHVTCQELGHIWGLDHQVALSCMDDCAHASTNAAWLACINDPNRTSPDAHDAAQLGAIYDHDDVADAPDGGDEGGGGPPCSRNPTHPRCRSGAAEWITVSAFPRRM